MNIDEILNYPIEPGTPDIIDAEYTTECERGSGRSNHVSQSKSSPPVYGGSAHSIGGGNDITAGNRKSRRRRRLIELNLVNDQQEPGEQSDGIEQTRIQGLIQERRSIFRQLDEIRFEQAVAFFALIYAVAYTKIPVLSDICGFLTSYWLIAGGLAILGWGQWLSAPTLVRLFSAHASVLIVVQQLVNR